MARTGRFEVCEALVGSVKLSCIEVEHVEASAVPEEADNREVFVPIQIIVDISYRVQRRVLMQASRHESAEKDCCVKEASSPCNTELWA
jgi:hypothetical protein